MLLIISPDADRRVLISKRESFASAKASQFQPLAAWDG